MNKKCVHSWTKSGIWDGKTPDGERTGGIVYRCPLCGDEVFSSEEALKKGGTINNDTDVFGKKI
jgi:hypothetical protein